MSDYLLNRSATVCGFRTHGIGVQVAQDNKRVTDGESARVTLVIVNPLCRVSIRQVFTPESQFIVIATTMRILSDIGNRWCRMRTEQLHGFPRQLHGGIPMALAR